MHIPDIKDSFSYFARFIRVVDGDTIEVELDLGLRLYHKCFIRLAWIDTPELNRKDQRPAGLVATTAVRHLIEQYCFHSRNDGETIPEGGRRLFIASTSFDKYANRVVGAVYFPSYIKSLNTWLVANGMAKRYGGKPWSTSYLGRVEANAQKFMECVDEWGSTADFGRYISGIYRKGQPLSMVPPELQLLDRADH